jgi:predicted amidophosphoribosyltransferase
VADAGPLICPRCATTHSLDERFCPSCGTPLTYHGSGAGETGERHERARKVQARYSEGPPVTVAIGRNQAEADLIANLLLEEGIPSLVRRSAAADVPEMLAAGARDVLVPASGAEAARQMLLQAELQDRAGPSAPSPGRLLAALLAAMAAGALVIWLISLAAD